MITIKAALIMTIKAALIMSIKAALIMTIKATLPHHRQNLWRRIRSSLPLGRVEPSIKPGQS